MGNSCSSLSPEVSEKLADYEELTYLHKFEILQLYQKFKNIVGPSNDPLEVRIPFELLSKAFPQLKYNPFNDRIRKVFSTDPTENEYLSFEDFLDLFSVMSSSCPSTVKANWAFKLFDFDGDNSIGENDIIEIIMRLTKGKELPVEHYQLIAHIILEQLDLESSGTISSAAFEHGIGKMEDFGHMFTFRI